MISKSDKPISSVLPLFNAIGCDVSFLAPTEVGLGKSILDATAEFREFLGRNALHDFDTQGQGNSDNGVILEATYVTTNELQKTQLSLYRPKTKKGDPRVWPYGLKDYASPNNLLAFCLFKNHIYIINCSDTTLFPKCLEAGGIFRRLFSSDRIDTNPNAQELLEKLRAIHDKGFIRTVTAGDTGIGMTLESELGIQANSSKAPDYKGIEVKASRNLPGRKNRVNLFSRVPNWKLSPIGSASNLLKKEERSSMDD